jgi:hypothetical protein
MQSVVDAVIGMFTGMKDSLISSINGIIDKLNALLDLWGRLSGLTPPTVPTIPSNNTASDERAGTYGGNTGGTRDGTNGKPRSEGRSSTVQVVYNINTSGNNVSWRNDVEIAKAFNQKV